jgi:hypothetical protein
MRSQGLRRRRLDAVCKFAVKQGGRLSEMVGTPISTSFGLFDGGVLLVSWYRLIARLVPLALQRRTSWIHAFHQLEISA